MKTIKQIILIMSIFAALFGCKEKTEKEEIIGDNSAVFDLTFKDGSAMLGNANFSYKNFKSKSKYPWCFHLAIPLDDDEVGENGIPNNISTTQSCYDLKDQLLKDIVKFEKFHYVGHYFADGYFDAFIYIQDLDKVHEYLQTQKNNPDQIRTFGYGISKDPKWKRVKELLEMENKIPK